MQHRFAKKRPDLAWMKPGDTPHPELGAGEIDQNHHDSGNAITSEIGLLSQQKRTVLFARSVQHFPATGFSGWRKLVAKTES